MVCEEEKKRKKTSERKKWRNRKWQRGGRASGNGEERDEDRVKSQNDKGMGNVTHATQ